MRKLVKISVCGLVGVLIMLFSTGCHTFPRRGWEELAVTNGFNAPVKLLEDRGQSQLVLEVRYGVCRIRLLTHKPWYDDYASTYLPIDSKQQPVENATADKLFKLPAIYDLAVCEQGAIYR